MGRAVSRPPASRVSFSAMRTAAAMLGLLLVAGTAAAAAPSVVPFIEDDYTKALAEARSRQVPLFIEAWAPW